MRLCCMLAVLLVAGCQKSVDDAATRHEADMAAQPERAPEARGVEHVSIASGETHRYVLGFKRDAASECALTAEPTGS